MPEDAARSGVSRGRLAAGRGVAASGLGWRSRLAAAAASALLLASSVAVAPVAASTGVNAASRHLDFDVYLGERRIGSQYFTLRRDGAVTEIETRARFAEDKAADAFREDLARRLHRALPRIYPDPG